MSINITYLFCLTKKITNYVGTVIIISSTGLTLANAKSIDKNTDAVEDNSVKESLEVDDDVKETSEVDEDVKETLEVEDDAKETLEVEDDVKETLEINDEIIEASEREQQYQLFKDSNADLSELPGFVAELVQTVNDDPEEAEAWEILAKVYYDNEYYNYALYCASEAVNLGVESKSLEYILLKSSVMLAEEQIKYDYLNEITDKQFLEQYQGVLSKIYGSIYNFNYDESLPKPVIRAKKRTNKAKSNKKRYKRNSYKTSKYKKRPTKSKKRSTSKAPKVKKIIKTKKTNYSSTPKPKSSTDPFKLVR